LGALDMLTQTTRYNHEAHIPLASISDTRCLEKRVSRIGIRNHRNELFSLSATGAHKRDVQARWTYFCRDLFRFGDAEPLLSIGYAGNMLVDDEA
jgi:hypothetical protein